ncbi:MAG: phosphatase PAP2 family protein [Candidatus Methanosuratincola sp.]
MAVRNIKRAGHFAARLALSLLLMSFPYCPCAEGIEQNVSGESFTGYLFKELPRNVISGVANSASPINIAILGLSLQGALVLDRSGADRSVQDDLRGTFGGYEDVGTYGGAWYTLTGIVLSSYVVARLRDDPKMIEASKALIEGQILTQIATGTLKLSVRRERPDGSSPLSFPSGHASATFALASTLQTFYGGRVGIPAYAFASYVALSRLSENKHFLSDVLVGAALGSVVGRGVALAHKRQISPFTLLPYSGGEGGGLALVVTW